MMFLVWRVEHVIKGCKSGFPTKNKFYGTKIEERIKKEGSRTELFSVKGTIERYKKACSDAVNPPSVTEANTQYYQQEASKLRRQIRDIQNSNRHIVGESLGSLNFKELKNLEGRLEKGISRVRSKKNELLMAEIEYMQKREMELQHDNIYLRAKISQGARLNPEQQDSSVIQGTAVYESGLSSHDQSQHYNRNYIPVNLLEPNQQFSGQDQPPLQLV
ncbi:hypothetical protein IGI04_027609 [Brassica rapa subsp. trilocularis]|uniref:K-box domain-containing protein n=1 Tax=Brassica rapa subsp. trilocularis TaxID=1813537 RepID=A0ABQ7L0I6_BRACM|nr:hypothetical protein IGI04_027609 [Brassica rapa subsp. trilocularis]